MSNNMLFALAVDRVVGLAFSAMICSDLRDSTISPENKMTWARYAIGSIVLGAAIPSAVWCLWMLTVGLRKWIPGVGATFSLTWRAAFPKKVSIPKARVVSEDRETR